MSGRCLAAIRQAATITAAPVTTVSDRGSEKASQPNSDALWRYAHVGKVMQRDMSLSERDGLNALVQVLERWTEALALPRLSAYGMREADIPHVVANCRGSSMKTNPIVLSDDEVAGILRARC